MGEVSFAAVLRWVTRVDDFTKLFADTCERERVLHLQRSEECALSYLNWRASPSDHFAVRAARAHISDYGCQFFAKQLRESLTEEGLESMPKLISGSVEFLS